MSLKKKKIRTRAVVFRLFFRPFSFIFVYIKFPLKRVALEVEAKRNRKQVKRRS